MATNLNVLVISDTHSRHVEQLPKKLLSAAKEADLIIHLGDFANMETYDYFKQTGKLCGVAGNHDPQEVKQELPRQDILEINGLRIGMTHGCTVPFGSQRKLRERFYGEKLDAILYGHTHIIRKELVDGILYFNPGSASAKFPAPWRSYGMLSIGREIIARTIATIENVLLKSPEYIKRVLQKEQLIRRLCGKPRLPDFNPITLARALAEERQYVHSTVTNE